MIIDTCTVLNISAQAEMGEKTATEKIYAIRLDNAAVGAIYSADVAHIT
jgi:hypothetical protein